MRSVPLSRSNECEHAIKEILGAIEAAEMDVEESEEQTKAVRDGDPSAENALRSGVKTPRRSDW